LKPVSPERVAANGFIQQVYSRVKTEAAEGLAVGEWVVTSSQAQWAAPSNVSG